MPTNNAAVAKGGDDASKAALEDAVTVDTQFGPMTFSKDSVLTFPNGLLGFGGVGEFALANLPDPALGNFKLMQSIDGSGLGFLVLPIDALPDHIHEDDLNAAFDALSIEKDNGLVLLIVTVRKTTEATKLTVNLRAPVIIDAASRRAYQHVSQNSAYPIQYEL
jgi:flagellar assembly factor FliW